MPQISNAPSVRRAGHRHLAVLSPVLATLAVLLASSVATAAPQGGRGVLNRAINALGGAGELTEVSALQIEATGETRAPFEGFDADENVAGDTYSRSYSIDRRE